MGRHLRQKQTKHDTDRAFLAFLRCASIEQLLSLQERYRFAKLWRRVAIQRAIVRAWSVPREDEPRQLAR